MTAPTSSSAPARRRWLFGRSLGSFLPAENSFLIVLAIAVGLMSGLAAVGFHLLIETTGLVVFERPIPVAFVPEWLRILIGPALGGLVAGLLIWLLARHDHGHGTASVMEAVALRGGRLSARPILTKVVAAGLLIGAGGSAGPEDPSVQIGSVIGSVTGQRLRLSERLVNTLVTAGVASAIAAAFNAPIAGVFFAMEIVASEFSTTLFAPVVLAAVSASIVSRALLGSEPAFQVPVYELVNPLIETPLYALLGVIAAAVGVMFVKAVFFSEAAFDRLQASAPIRALVGGLLVGGIALWVPAILGVGYDRVGAILNGRAALGLALLTVLVGKFLATAITLGAAEVGGTFAPSLFLGAALGGLYGQAVDTLLPGLTAPPAAYALVGMGAVLTAVVRAPITAVLLLFEVTGDYRIILPIMASVVFSELFAHRLLPESIYTERLARKGMHLRFGRDINILELVTVGEAMTPDFRTVPHTMTIGELEDLFDGTRHHGFPVLDDDGRLVGMVALSDLHRAAEEGLPPDTPVEKIAAHELIVAYPDQSLNAALRLFGQADVGRLPVVDRADPTVLRGVVRRGDIVKAYNRGAMRRTEMEQRLQQMRIGSQSGAHLVDFTIPPGGAADGRRIRHLQLPAPALITAIRRDGQAVLAHGDAILHAGDVVTVLTIPERVAQVQARLTSSDGEDTTPTYHELIVSSQSPAVGKTVAELRLPPQVLIVALRRNGQLQAVHGSTKLASSDDLTILASRSQMPAIIECFVGDAAKVEVRQL